MIEVAIPGSEKLRLQHLVLDYNGTLACDGKLLPGVTERLDQLAKTLSLHVITADTFGAVEKAVAGLPLTLQILPQTGQTHAKEAYVTRLGHDGVVAIGNGRNDRLMLQKARLGIAVVGPECAASETARVADLITSDIQNALDLLLNPMRLVATLRE